MYSRLIKIFYALKIVNKNNDLKWIIKVKYQYIVYYYLLYFKEYSLLIINSPDDIITINPTKDHISKKSLNK